MDALESIAILVGLGMGAAFLVLPIIAVVTAASARKRAEAAERALFEIQQRLYGAEWRIGEIQRYLSSQAQAQAAAVRPAEPQPAPAAPAASAARAAAPEAGMSTPIETRSSTAANLPETDHGASPRALNQGPEDGGEAATAGTPTSTPTSTSTSTATRSSTAPSLPETDHGASPRVLNQGPEDGGEAATAGTSTSTATPTSTPTATATSAPTPTPPFDRGPYANPAPPPPPPPAPFDWENLIGVRLFAWLGGAALFIGIALFLNYSIQHNLIAPAARVGLGLVFGAAALAFGDFIRVKTDRAGQALSGAGVAILYASLFAARSLYHLIETLPTFAAMIAVTGVAGVMAVKRGAFMLAILGLLGGMATPYLLSTGEDKPLALLAYISLLEVGVIVVAKKRRWPSLALLALLGSGVIFVGWAMSFLDGSKLPYALVAAGGLASLFAFGRWDDAPSDAPAGALPRATTFIAAAAPLFLSLVVASTHHLAVSPMVLVPYLVVVSAGAWIASRRADAPPLLLLAAGISVITLFVRADDDLFPSSGPTTLLLYGCVSLAWLVLWLVRRDAVEGKNARAAAAIVLGGSLLVTTRVLFVESSTLPILPLALWGAAHVAALVAIGVLEGAGGWVLAGQGLSVATLLALTTRFSESRLDEFLPAVLVPMLAFFALPGLGRPLARDRAMWLSSALALDLHFPILFLMARHAWGTGPLGAAAVACGVLSLVMLRHARMALVDEPKERITATAAFGANTLLFVTAAIPILVSNEWITVAWALESASLAWLLRRVPHRGLYVASAILAAAAFVRLLFNPAVWEYHARSETPLLNFYLYTFGLPALALFAAARFLEPEEPLAGVRFPPVLRAGGVVLLFVLLNVEIADFYSTGTAITFRFSGGGLAQDMTYSLAWGAFALSLLGWGIVTKKRPPRIGALVVLILTIAKVFLHDLWELGSLYRVGSIVGLAFALLLVSFLIQRFILRTEAK